MPATKPIRWWPDAVISALGAVAYLWLLFSPTENQQERTFQYLLVILATGLLLLLWAMLFSRLGWKRKLGVLGALIAFVAAMAALFRIESVSGDLVPILAFRWSGPDSLEGGVGAAAVETSPNDFPQFLGQNRTGEVTGVTLDPDWDANPPKELWRRKVGEACSGFVVVGDAAITFEQRQGDAGGEQVVVRYDLKTGDVVWSHGLPGAYESVIGGNGPRSTPTVADGKVFAFGPLGHLRALDLVSGSLVWQRD
ncbi:MAG: PQQ-binding-like beta-propeller repeat protein, partial [Acidobacteriota bacterium]